MRRGTLRAVVGISEVALDSVGAVTPVLPRNSESGRRLDSNQRSGSLRESLKSRVFLPFSALSDLVLTSSRC
jgi:hypothetical protein